jgi:crotonobetainyl-CoA:carnitine CoA-transferase CaiB-like acyl-CoA transferase
MSELPLKAIRVIDFGQIYAGPYCTSQLAYLGADVVKIEPLESGEYLRMPQTEGGASYAFLLLNANKKSVALNLKHPSGPHGSRSECGGGNARRLRTRDDS